MKYASKLLIVGLIAGLVIPAGLFAKRVVAKPNTSLPQLVMTGPVLQVVPAPDTAVVTAKTTSLCNFNAIVTSNLVQNTGVINLNQSAGCFTLQNAPLSVSQHLAVTSAINNATVAVVGKSATSWNQLHAAEPLPSTMPALPSPGLTLLLTIAVLTFVSAKRKRQPRVTNLTSAPSLSQLQVMRC
jgi:hypothetical protein